MKEVCPDIHYVSLPFDPLDSHEREVPGPSTRERQEIANLAGASECLALLHWALERSSATGQP